MRLEPEELLNHAGWRTALTRGLDPQAARGDHRPASLDRAARPGQAIVKPTRAQYFYAANWPARIWLVAVCLLSAAVALLASGPITPLLETTSGLKLLAGVLGLSLLLGYCVAILLGWYVLGPFYRARAIRNGAPFQPGDLVQVLSGRHRGRIARVYAEWQGECVRVDLGEEEKRRLRDIFSQIELLRESADQPPPL